jgi:DMSO/TMAO reductase YedYZ molybdopterin-dependent catalytic subunit
MLGVAVVAGAFGRALMRSATAAAEAARVAIGLPGVADPAPRIPAGADIGVPGLSPFVTPNRDFYRVDTALTVPSLDVEGWQLSIHGMVDRPLTLTYEQLLERPLMERDITLTCVSNEVGGRYVGNARWVGVSLRDLLGEAGVRTGVDQIVGRSSDGFTTGTPASVALDGRDAMLAVAMNGEPLPLVHGFPVRMVIPGLYGYESACKWLTEIELTTYAAFSAYWVRRGWAEQAPIRTSSRIDTPTGRDVRTGEVTVAGVAWAQHRGIDAVEVSVDDGEWTPAMLGEVISEDTWRHWSAPWTATAGTHTLAVRAVDGDGVVQTDDEAPPFPRGSSGIHRITVTVR